ncbi:MAG TPA: AI-2E family transporter, partial [Amnibacterium sp.]|nr:AI-2E family transporter [Amnibacterium sp.]
MSGPAAHGPLPSRPPRRGDLAPPDPSGFVSTRDSEAALPFGIRLAGGLAWRLIAIAVVVLGFVALLARLGEIVIPLVVAILLSALLTPLKHLLERRGLPRWLAVLLTFLTMLVAVGGLITLVVFTVSSGVDQFDKHLVAFYGSTLDALRSSPLGISQTDVNHAVTSATDFLKSNSSRIAAGALTGADVLIHTLVAVLLTLFITLFLLIDGAGVWRWCVRLAPRKARAAVDGAAKAAWLSLHEYVRVQIVVALIDGIAIGVIAAVLGVPFAVPLGVLVFLGAFIPIVGAVTTGLLAVLAALVYNGPINAVLMLAGIVAVNQVESHVLHPLLLGGAVRLHPIAVVLAVAGGSVIAGIVGAVFAVPLAAATNSAVKYVAGGEWKGKGQPPTGPVPEEGHPSPRRDDEPRPPDV